MSTLPSLPLDESMHSTTARGRRIGEKLRAGEGVSDCELDELYPMAIRVMSTTYWTPVNVARRAAELLVDKPGCRVLDVGSGAGKFCVIGASTTAGTFFGVEHRASLVEAARELAVLVEAPSATFTHGLFSELDPKAYDAFYFFNPFEENTFSERTRFDASVLLSKERFAQDVRKAQAFLRAARPGARVVTYNGMGGKVPACFDLVQRDTMGCGMELWVKAERGSR